MLKDHIQSSDAIGERELRETLSALQRELATWMQTARPRADRVPLELIPQELQLEHLKGDFHDPRGDRPAPPLSSARKTTSHRSALSRSADRVARGSRTYAPP
jgi:hypothetical protein